MALYRPLSVIYSVFNVPEPPLWHVKLTCSSGRLQLEKFNVCQSSVCFLTQRLTSSWTISRTYLPFFDEVTHSIHDGDWGSVCKYHHHALLRLPDAIQALRPVADQLKSGNYLNVDYNCQTYHPFSDEVTRCIRDGGWGSVCEYHHYALLRPPNAIQALRPPANPHQKPAPGWCTPYGVVCHCCM